VVRGRKTGAGGRRRNPKLENGHEEIRQLVSPLEAN